MAKYNNFILLKKKISQLIIKIKIYLIKYIKMQILIFLTVIIIKDLIKRIIYKTLETII